MTRPKHGVALGAAVVLAAFTAATAGSAPASYAAGLAPRAGTPLVLETFKNATAPDFTGYNEACLTGAAPGAPQPGPHALGGCGADAVGPVPPNTAAPHGYLRLTDAGNNRTAAALYNKAIPADEGLDVTFEQWQYGGQPVANPADGISFFLADGEGNLLAPGQFGGSLGYAQKQQHLPTGGVEDTKPGVENGFLGVGLDVLGNYFADTEQRGHGCPAGEDSPAIAREQDAQFYLRGPNTITLRGPGNGIDGYCYMTSTTPFPHSTPPGGGPWPSSLNAELQGPLMEFNPANPSPQEAEQQLASSGRTVNVRITPTPDSRTIVSVDFGHGMETVLNEATPTPLPPTYKFGFAASTGHFSDVHLVRNVVIQTEEPLPELNLVKQIALPRPGELKAGDKITYEYVLTNGGTIPIENLAVTDPKIGTVTCPTEPLGPGETVTCTGIYEVQQSDVEAGEINNTAVAAGEANGAPVRSNEDSEHVPISLPASLTVDKVPTTPGPYHVGQTVQYTYTVSNTGGVPLHHITISDDKVTGITCEPTTIAPANEPGNTATCHGSYVITENDGFNGEVINTAVAIGTHDDEEVVSEPDQASILVGAARLHLTKRVVSRGPFFTGSAVHYEYTVKNTGPQVLHDIVIQDSHVARITCERTTLEPGESTTCRGTYRVRHVDFRAGSVRNTAQAFGIENNGDIFQSNFASAFIRVEKKPVPPKPRPKPKPRPRPRPKKPIPVTG